MNLVSKNVQKNATTNVRMDWEFFKEKIEGAIKNGQSRDTGNAGHKTRDEDKQNTKTQYRKLKRW